MKIPTHASKFTRFQKKSLSIQGKERAVIYFSRDFNFSALFVKTSNDFRVDPCDVKISQFGRDDDLGNFRPAETLSRFEKNRLKQTYC